jgi:hypothetical protein
VNFIEGVGLYLICAMIVAKIMYRIDSKGKFMDADDPSAWVASMILFWPVFAIGLIFVYGFKLLVWIVKF